MTTPATSAAAPTRVIVAGAGFAGVRAARRLARDPRFAVTVISPEPTFAFYPQLYHAATGGARDGASLPLDDLFAGLPIERVQARVTALDPAARTVTTDTGQTLPFDKLMLALGNVTNYFGIAGLAEFSYDIKTMAGAERFKQHLHQELTADHKPDLNYVVVGGGPTGVELAASLGEYLRRIVRLHGIEHPQYSIELVEAAPRLLPRSSEAMSAKVQRRLERLGVKVMTGATVAGETADTLHLNGRDLTTHTVIWTAGVTNNPFFKANSAFFTLAKNGKVEVNEYLEAAPGIYVTGDNAATTFSGMAQTAINDADFVAADLRAHATGRARRAYRPLAPVSVIPVGGYWAAVQWGPVSLYGYTGWILRRLADLVAYADVENYVAAAHAWLQDLRRDDSCPVCANR